MLLYEDGISMKVGDAIGFEEGRFEGIVEEVIEDLNAQQYWGVDGPGVMVKAPEFGLVFLPVKLFPEDWPIRLS